MSTPTFKSFQQILKSLIQEFVYKSGVTDLYTGSVARSFLEAAALSDYKIQADIMNALASVDIDRAIGPDLDKIGYSKSVQRLQAKESNGTITVYHKGLTKISTKIYQGTAAPPAGSTTINIADATDFPPIGSVYIGRGTNNYEGPIPYTSIVPSGTYFQLVLASPTTKNHNTGESVILAQGGNRVVPAGSLVQTRATLTSPAITFSIIETVTLLDGEVEIKNVPVVCTQVGTVGNIPAGAIVEFASEPFPGAAATNPLSFISGRDIMSDAEYRDLIKKVEQSRVRGTDLAIIQAAIGVQSKDDNKTVTSAEIRKPANRNEPSVLFIDDSTGYQPIFKGQGFEPIIDNANGGERYLQLKNEDLVRASVISALEAPFAIAGGMKLAVRVGGKISEHTFASGDFATENAADTFEIINSINNNSNLLFSARGFDNNRRIVLFSKSYSHEDIEVVKPTTGVDANEFLGFPTTLTYTLRLYKNDTLLIKDGIVPTIYSNPRSTWSNTITNGATLTVKVDQTGDQTVTIYDTDFVPYGHPVVSKNNSLESWAKVLTNKIAGITVEVEGDRLKMTSNKGASNEARLEIKLPASLIAGGMWNAEVSEGKTSDYSLNRSTGQIELAIPASANDVFTAGSKFTRAFIDSSEFPSGTITIPSAPIPKLYFIVDAEAEKINTSLSSAATVTITNPSGNRWRYTFSLPNVISGVQKDDIVIITDNIALSANNIGYWRVHDVDPSGAWFEVIKTVGTLEGPIALSGSNDIIFVRSPEGEIQTAILPTGLQTLTNIANSIKSLDGIMAEIISGKKIRVSSLSFNKSFGKIFLAGQNSSAAAAGFITGDYDTSEISHTAFNSSKKDLTFIEFIHDAITTGDNVAPYTNITTLTNLESLGYDPNGKMVFLNPFGSNISTNRKLEAEIADINSTNVLLRNSLKLKEIITSDRYFLGVPYNFNALDNFVVVLDKDTTNKTFNIRLGRKGKIYNSPNASTFNAYDIDFSPTANYPASFGNNFDFSDFKVHFKARTILDPSGTLNKMLVRAAQFGPNGNQIKVGIFYPTLENNGLKFSADIKSDTRLKIFLASGPLRTGGTWDATTEFDVTFISGNTYRYTYNGNGTAPNFLSAGIVVGDIVNISNSSTFSSQNTGIFKVTAVTNTYFEVTNYGPGIVETNRTLSTTSALKFYPLDSAANTAILIGTFINNDTVASEYISIDQLETGAGVVSSSTLDDSNGATEYYSLMDGENWISSSNIGTNITPINSFTLKKPLNIFGADLLNEEFYLIPTKAEHLDRFLNKFAVTGLSSIGNITRAEKAKSIQIYSNLFGSEGTVHITGGSGNKSIAAVLDSGALVDNNYIKFGISKSASLGFQKGQWIKISNSELLAKNIKINPATQISWDSINPIPNKSKITINNSNSSNLYQNGYFYTRRYHDGDNTTQIRVEKHGPFVALIWTGVGTAPNFTKSFTVTNRSRTSQISTITLSTPHGIPIGSSVEIKVNIADTSFNGTFRAVASSATDLQYRQALPDIASGATSGNTTRMVRKTDRIFINGTSFAVLNRGEFLIVGVYGNNTLYIDNPNAIEEDVILNSNSDITIYDYDSVRPGDIFSVGSNILNSTTPFESHQGAYVIDSLGASETEIFITSNTTQDVGPVTLGPNFNTVKVIEEKPFVMYSKIYNLATSSANINNVDVVIIGEEIPSKITPSAGTVIESMSKLGFETIARAGEDSYKYYGGLVSAVGQVIRGKPSDPISYPGIAAAGSYIEIESALPKRIQLSIVIRNRTGTPFTIIKSRVQTAVASYINSLGVGKSVVFSEIVKIAQSINGVQAVSISSPIYSPANDQILSQPDQKPLVFNLDQDIIVSQAT